MRNNSAAAKERRRQAALAWGGTPPGTRTPEPAPEPAIEPDGFDEQTLSALEAEDETVATDEVDAMSDTEIYQLLRDAEVAVAESARQRRKQAANLKVQQRRRAREKASRPEGGGHHRPQTTEAGLVRVRHVSQFRWVNYEKIPFEGPRRCPISIDVCLDCMAEAQSYAERRVTAQLHLAGGVLREKRREAAAKNSKIRLSKQFQGGHGGRPV